MLVLSTTNKISPAVNIMFVDSTKDNDINLGPWDPWNELEGSRAGMLRLTT